eukprot:TRINITY_DN1691_c0_g1_i6.p1 TRINITY_DN1691_c0_g1~~TRINITY_DN1691_c0_g1_i6.p1  ORF type:complete len:479 (-),score=88.26 TRINITY_DN1691_c0_g1_i6:150-1586(-)
MKRKKEEEKKDEAAEERKDPVISEEDAAAQAANAELLEIQTTQQNAFLEAARFNYPAKLEELIQNGVNINCKDNDGWNALMHACCQGNEEIVRILLKKKQMIEPSSLLSIDDKKDADDLKEDLEEKIRQYTPLHWAANKGHLRIVWLLLLRGNSTYDEDPYGSTPMHQAAAGASLNVIECFLSQGVDIEKKNSRGHTPFDLASDPEVRQFLAKAISVKNCVLCGQKFDFIQVRHYCTRCHKYICKNCCEKMVMDETIDSIEKERPICLCKECVKEHKLCTKLLDDALNNWEFEKVDKFYKMIEKRKAEVDVKKLHHLQRHHLTLKHELKIRNFYTSLEVVPSYKTIKKSVHLLNEMVKQALDEKVDLSQACLGEVNQCTKRLLAERDLRLHLDTCDFDKIDEANRDQLKELMERAMEAGVSDDYVKDAAVIVDKMTKNLQAKQILGHFEGYPVRVYPCLLYTSPSPRDLSTSRMPSSA